MRVPPSKSIENSIWMNTKPTTDNASKIPEKMNHRFRCSTISNRGIR